MSAAVEVARSVADESSSDDDRALEVRLKLVTRVRGIYQAARRALRLVHAYRAECLVRREEWRSDKRILACLEQVAAYRTIVRALRLEAVNAHVWPITHGCGAVITAVEWPRLLSGGRWQLNEDDPPAEQRVCPRCKSHITVAISELPGGLS